MANDWTYFYNIMQEQQKQNAIGEQMRREQEAKDARAKFATDRDVAMQNAYRMGTNYFQQLGLPQDDVLVNSIIDELTQKVPDLDANPASYYTPSAFGAGLNERQDISRQRYGRSVNETFAPGFEENLLPDSSIDSIIDTILNEHSGRARQQVEANRARGVLNDTGYNASLDALGDQGVAARSTLRGVGQNVLGTKRDELSQIRGQAGNAASTYQYGSPAPDIGSYFTRAQNEATSALGDLEGSIRAALGDTSLFDPATALQFGGIGQGAINLTNAPTDFVPQTDRKRQQAGRGLGSTGTF